MKLSVRLRSRAWAAGAAVLVLILVMSLTGASSKPAGASGPPGALTMVPATPEIVPGLARAETDTLDLQLD